MVKKKGGGEWEKVKMVKKWGEKEFSFFRLQRVNEDMTLKSN